MAAWQSPTVGLASEVWHTGAVRSGVGHCANTEVACAIAMAIRARLNIVAGYLFQEVSDGYDFSEEFYLLLSFQDVDDSFSWRNSWFIYSSERGVRSADRRHRLIMPKPHK